MRFRKIAAALLTLALGFCLCQPAAFAATAADQHAQLQELPVSIQSTGETPLPKETLTVELEAVDNAPLPQVTTLDRRRDRQLWPHRLYQARLLRLHRVPARRCQHPRHLR